MAVKACRQAQNALKHGFIGQTQDGTQKTIKKAKIKQNAYLV